MNRIDTHAKLNVAPGSAGAGDRTTAVYRPIFNSATGERIEFIDIAEEALRLNWSSMPGGAITEHIHPNQQERFMITAGEAHFTVNGEACVVGPGEALDVPAGVRHSERNPGAVEVIGIVELRPALRAKQMFEAFAGLASEGSTTPRGAPRNPLQLGATVWHFRHESRVTSPPLWLQNLILPPLWALAKVCHVRPYHNRWDSQTTPTSELTP